MQNETTPMDSDDDEIHIEIACDDEYIPPIPTMVSWVKVVLDSHVLEHYSLNIKIIDNHEMQTLNKQFRNKDASTNVLSFPADMTHHAHNVITWLGDIAICANVVNIEAEQQQKTADAHWAHMIVHSCLHLLGFDHLEEADADAMESLETDIICGMGFPMPYLSNHQLN